MKAGDNFLTRPLLLLLARPPPNAGVYVEATSLGQGRTADSQASSGSLFCAVDGAWLVWLPESTRSDEKSRSIRRHAYDGNALELVRKPSLGKKIKLAFPLGFTSKTPINAQRAPIFPLERRHQGA